MRTYIGAMALIAFSIPPAFGQQQPGPVRAPETEAQQPTPSPAQVDEQIANMQELMTQMNQQMTQLQQTQDPEQRQHLLQEHWTTMQNAMTMMHGMWGMGAAGCCGTGRMMGPMMTWGDYRNLTPERLAQRQYMMDRWMPLQQMMMDHMMQHQGWKMGQPPATPRQ